MRQVIRRCAAPALIVCVLVALLAPGAAHAAADPSIVTSRDLVFAQRPHVQLRADVRWSTRTAPGAPIVILIHGGGWWYGTRRDLMDTAPVATTFAKAGFVAISIDYRLACGMGTPAPPRVRYGVNYDRRNSICGAHIWDQIADVHDAVRFARAHASEWGADPRRVTLLGASAGGHLALLAAETAPVGARVRAVANWSGPSSTKFIALENPFRKPSIIGSFTNALGCMWSSSTRCQSQWNAVSPFLRLKRTTPRFAVLAVSGARENQVPASTHRQFDVKLRKLGRPSQVIALPSSCHGAGCRHLYVHTSVGMRTVEAATVAFLEAHA